MSLPPLVAETTLRLVRECGYVHDVQIIDDEAALVHLAAALAGLSFQMFDALDSGDLMQRRFDYTSLHMAGLTTLLFHDPVVALRVYNHLTEYAGDDSVRYACRKNATVKHGNVIDLTARLKH
jgi:hypothetical protein